MTTLGLSASAIPNLDPFAAKSRNSRNIWDEFRGQPYHLLFHTYPLSTFVWLHPLLGLASHRPNDEKRTCDLSLDWRRLTQLVGFGWWGEIGMDWFAALLRPLGCLRNKCLHALFNGDTRGMHLEATFWFRISENMYESRGIHVSFKKEHGHMRMMMQRKIGTWHWKKNVWFRWNWSIYTHHMGRLYSLAFCCVGVKWVVKYVPATSNQIWLQFMLWSNR